MNPIIQQMLIYCAVVLLAIIGIALFLRGFFFKYYKVRMSFGKFFMVKVRSQLRDYFEVGKIEDGFLVYKHEKKNYRISLPKGVNPFYKSIAVTWVDVDEEKSAICLTDYTTVTGHDVVKEDYLLQRALMRPAVMSKKDIIIIICVILTLLASIVALYFAYKNYTLTKELIANLPETIKEILAGKGTITGSSKVI